MELAVIYYNYKSNILKKLKSKEKPLNLEIFSLKLNLQMIKTICRYI